MQKTLLIYFALILLPLQIFADRVMPKDFLEAQNILKYHTIDEKKTACTHYYWNDSFCSNFSLKYPYSKSIDNRAIAKIVDKRVEELNKEYTKNIYNIESVIDELNPDYNDTGHFDWDKSLKLFSFTPATVTLYFTQSRYTGGAHANYDDYFENYDLKSGKSISLNELVTDMDGFTNSVEEVYKKRYEIPKNEDMTYDGWFDKEFRLADSVACTPAGFYFLYNVYEIKAYADGLTPLFVPYSRVKKFLNKSYFNNTFFKKSAQLAATYHKSFQNKLSISIRPNGSDKLDISLEVKDLPWESETFLSVAFLDIKHLQISNLKSDFQKTNSYPDGTPIYNRISKKNIKEHNLLIEGYENIKKPKKEINRKLSFTIKKLKEGSKLTLLVRLLHKRTYQKGKTDYTYYPKDGSWGDDIINGDQGYQNYKIELRL